MSAWSAAQFSMIAASAVAGGAVAYSVFCSSSQLWIPVVRHIADDNAVALTFDDGPTDPFTPRILDILHEWNAKATFFVIGRHVAKDAQLLRRMVQEGHTVGNHTFDHHHLGVMRGTAYWRSQLMMTNDAVFDACGCRPTLFRPPMGFKTGHQAWVLRQMNMRVVGWRVRAFDTRAVSGEALAQRMVTRLRKGDIVGMHDGVEPARRGQSQQVTVEALPGILRHLRKCGWRSISMAQAMAGPVYNAGDGSASDPETQRPH